MILGLAFFIFNSKAPNPYVNGLAFALGLEAYYSIKHAFFALHDIGLSTLDMLGIIAVRELVIFVLITVLSVIIHKLWTKDKRLLLLLPLITVVLAIIENSWVNYVAMFTLDFGIVFLGTIWEPLFSMVGSYGMQGLLVLCALLLVFILQKEKGLATTVFIFLVVVSIVAIASPAHDQGKQYSVAVIQAVPLPQHDMSPELMANSYENALTRYNNVKENVDITVWPEGELPDPIVMLKNKAQSLVAPVLIAGGEFMPEEGGIRLGQHLIANGNSAFITKKNLAPLGEYIPWYLKLFAGALEPEKVVDTDLEEPIAFKSQKFGALTCFDINEAWEARRQVRDGANVIISSFSNVFYGEKGLLAAKVDLQRARTRAIETGRWIIRSGQGGITAIINSRGVITQQLPWWTDGIITGVYKTKENKTLFVQYGYWLNILWLLPWAFFCALPLIRRERNV